MAASETIVFKEKDTTHFLNNYYPSPIEKDGRIWRNAYEYFGHCYSSYLAERGCMEYELDRTQIHQYSSTVMKHVLDEKFKNKELQEKLLETGDARIVFKTHSSTFWGINSELCRASFNELGQLLMKKRDELRDIETYIPPHCMVCKEQFSGDTTGWAVVCPTCYDNNNVIFEYMEPNYTNNNSTKDSSKDSDSDSDMGF